MTCWKPRSASFRNWAMTCAGVCSPEAKWTVETRSPMVAGVLATAGGLVFTGDAEGFLTAYDAETGAILPMMAK